MLLWDEAIVHQQTPNASFRPGGVGGGTIGHDGQACAQNSGR